MNSNRYTKALIIILMMVVCAASVTGVMKLINTVAVDANRSYKYAILYTPDGEIFHEGEITRYIIHTALIEVKFKNDGWYCTSVNNCALYGERDIDKEMGMHDM